MQNDEGTPKQSGAAVDDSLDREHHDRLHRVGRNDTKAGQDESARREDGRLVEEVQELAAKREALGSDEHVAACRRCKWSPYALRLWLGSRLAWMLDTVLWGILWGGLWWLWLRYYKDTTPEVPGWVYVSALAVPVLAVTCAKTAKGLGQHVGVARLTDPNSVNDTVDRQVAFAGTAAVAAGILLLAILALLFFSPQSWASWSTYISGLLGFGANIALGLSAGVGGNAAELLLKPAERDDVDCQIAMKERTRRLLRKFFLGVVLALGLANMGDPAQAAVASTIGDSPLDPRHDLVLVKAVDITDSGDPNQRERGIAAMVDRSPEQARRLGAQAILVITFADELLLSNMTWVPVPQRPSIEDCDKVSPKFRVTKSAMMLSPVGMMEARDIEVHACLARRESAETLLAEQDRRMRDQLRQAMRVPPRGDVSTRIVPLLKKLVTRPYVRVVELLTDGIDTSGLPLSTLTVPDGVRITLIIARPNPRRRSPTLDQVLVAAEAWEHVPGVSVTTVSEYAGFSQFAEAR